MSDLSKLDYALQQAQKGFWIFPCHPWEPAAKGDTDSIKKRKSGKVAAIAKWPEFATRDAKQIREWWRENSDYNIGMRADKFGDKDAIVIDVDVKNGVDGSASLAQLEMDLGPLPQTLVHATPSGGEHIIYTAARTVSGKVATLGPGLDLRSYRNYIIGPGSTIDGEPYTIKSDRRVSPLPLERGIGRRIREIGDAPAAERITDLSAPDSLDAEDVERTVTTFLAGAAPAIEGQNGDKHTCNTANECMDLGATPEVTAQLMWEHYNPRCEPPWEMSELRKKVFSIAKSRTTPIGSSNPKEVFKDFKVETLAALPKAPPKPLLHAPIDWSTLVGRFPPAREWLLDQMVPLGHVTSLYGKGSVGKTLVSMQIGVCVALGKPVFGLAAREGRVLGLFCEDEHDELWRRTARISTSLEASLSDLTGRFDMHPRVGLDNVLATFSAREGLVVPGPLFHELYAKLMDAQEAADSYTLLILDNVAQMMAVQENDRAQVTQAVNLLARLADTFNCAVLLLAHTAKAVGSQYSGTTAWENTVRSRLLLQRKTDKDGVEDLKSDALILSCEKANYAARGDLGLRYDDGFYRRTDGPATDEAEITRRAELDNDLRETLLSGLDHCNDKLKIEPTNSHTSTSRYLPKLLVEHDLNNGFPLDALKKGLMNAIRDGAICVERRKDRKGHDYTWIQRPSIATQGAQHV